ncbi:MAG: lipopolysaccharide biosynthesis protein [Ignavibacteriae bacterium]|nr:lipopolysaccharide biosynthesis protein [Ignavibacteriota bacterium]
MSDLRKKIRSGIFYSGLARYSDIVVSIIIGALLARLLTPKEFGIVTIITVISSFFTLLSRFGISTAIVQNKDLTEEDLSSIFTFTIIIGFFFSFLFYIASPFIASFYEHPVLEGLSKLMSISILFNSLQIVPNAIILKNLKFKEMGITSVVIHLLTGIVAVVLAYLDFGYYALIINGILNGILLFISYFYLGPVTITLKIKYNALRKIAKFSTYQFLFTFINYFAGNLDNLLIGKFFNAATLGNYDKAYKLMLMPVQNLTQVITPVLHPVLSNHQDDYKLIYDAYYKIVKLLAIIGFPLSIFLFFNASEIIFILYGPQWGESISVFKILALAVGIQIVLSSTGSIFQATNRTDLLFYSGLISTIFVVLGILYGIFIGKDLISIGYGILIAFSLNTFQAFYLLIKYALKNSFRSFVKLFYYPILMSLVLLISLNIF